MSDKEILTASPDAPGTYISPKEKIVFDPKNGIFLHIYHSEDYDEISALVGPIRLISKHLAPGGFSYRWSVQGIDGSGGVKDLTKFLASMGLKAHPSKHHQIAAAWVQVSQLPLDSTPFTEAPMFVVCDNGDLRFITHCFPQNGLQEETLRRQKAWLSRVNAETSA